MTTDVTIMLNEPGPSFQRRYPTTVVVQHQPPEAGVDYYEIDWERPRGNVRIENGPHSFVVREVLSVVALQELRAFASEGLYQFDINAGITSSDLISHDEARLTIHKILSHIMHVGWRQVIARSRPRLKGKFRQDYMFATSSINGLDASYVPTLKDWMRLENRTPWTFYASKVYLQVSFSRESTLMDPSRPGSYLLVLNFKSEIEYFRSFAGPDNRLRWKELAPRALLQSAVSRNNKEAELRAQGVVIDESYEDPPVPDFLLPVTR